MQKAWSSSPAPLEVEAARSRSSSTTCCLWRQLGRPETLALRPQSRTYLKKKQKSYFYLRNHSTELFIISYINPGMYFRTLKKKKIFTNACAHHSVSWSFGASWIIIYFKKKKTFMIANITTYLIEKFLKPCESVKLRLKRNQFEFYFGAQLFLVTPPFKMHATVKSDPLTPPNDTSVSLQLPRLYNENVWHGLHSIFPYMSKRKTV